MFDRLSNVSGSKTMAKKTATKLGKSPEIPQAKEAIINYISNEDIWRLQSPQ